MAGDLPPTAEEPGVQAVQQAIAAVPLVEADFREKRILKALNRPLESKGRLVFSRRYGVYRRQAEPFVLETVISSRGVFQRSGGAWRALDATRGAGAQGILNGFLSAFSGDAAVWREQFSMDFAGSAEAWRIRLTPRPGRPLARRVKGIALEGSRGLLFHLTMEEAGGASTETFFSAHKIRGEPSEDEDLAFFPEELRASLRP